MRSSLLLRPSRALTLRLLGAVPLLAVQVRAVPLLAVQVQAVPLLAVQVQAVPLLAVQVQAVPMPAERVRAVQVRVALPWSWPLPDGAAVLPAWLARRSEAAATVLANEPARTTRSQRLAAAAQDAALVLGAEAGSLAT